MWPLANTALAALDHRDSAKFQDIIDNLRLEPHIERAARRAAGSLFQDAQTHSAMIFELREPNPFHTPGTRAQSLAEWEGYLARLRQMDSPGNEETLAVAIAHAEKIIELKQQPS